jgi:hypothetical protein
METSQPHSGLEVAPIAGHCRETVKVCIECRPQHPRAIDCAEFEACYHEGTDVHICTHECLIRPCAPFPGKQLGPQRGQVQMLGPNEMEELSNIGFFSQAPPVYNLAPCGGAWKRNSEIAPFNWSQRCTSFVKLCTWACPRGCCFLRPHLYEFYFQLPSNMYISRGQVLDMLGLLEFYLKSDYLKFVGQ